MLKSRASVVFYLFLVFASGILVGAVSHRLYATSTARASSSNTSLSEFRTRYLQSMREKVGITDEQNAAISRTFDETKRKYDALAAQEKPLHDKIQQEHIEEVRALLNDQQRAAYDKWRSERDRALVQSRGKK